MTEEIKKVKKPNYWNLTIAAVKEMITERDLDMNLLETPFNRKEAIKALQIDDMKSGDGSDLLVEDEDGQLIDVETRTEVIKVRFHNTIQDRTPYVYVGFAGKSYYIPKEEDIYIPKILIDAVINDAVETHTEMVTLANGKIQHVEKKIMRFPYTELHDR
jgi:hypothetical protein